MKKFFFVFIFIYSNLSVNAQGIFDNIIDGTATTLWSNKYTVSNETGYGDKEIKTRIEFGGKYVYMLVGSNYFRLKRDSKARTGNNNIYGDYLTMVVKQENGELLDLFLYKKSFVLIFKEKSMKFIYDLTESVN